MMEKFTGPRLPELSASSRELINAAALFAFEGQPSELLHPDVDREKCFPDSVVMPVQELPFRDRCITVAMAVGLSCRLVSLDSVCGADQIARVSSPAAYRELLRTSEQFEKYIECKGPLFDESDYTADDVEPYVVVGVLCGIFAKMAEQLPNGIKTVFKILDDAQPKLQDDETRADRRNVKMLDEERKLFRWRYARTLAVAGAAGAAAIASLLGAHSVEHKNSSRIAALENERDTTYKTVPHDIRQVVNIFLDEGNATELLNTDPPAVAEAQEVVQRINYLDIDMSNLKRQSDNKKNSALWFGAISLGALSRFGLWRSQRPKRQNG